MSGDYSEIGGEDEIEDTSEDMSDDISRSDEYETLRKEVFLALYNLWRIAERHEKAVQEHRDAVLRIETLLKGNLARAVSQGGVKQGGEAVSESKESGGIPGWVYAVAGGVFLLLIIIIAALFLLKR